MSDRQIAEMCFVVFLTYILAAMARAMITMIIMLWQDLYTQKGVTD